MVCPLYTGNLLNNAGKTHWPAGREKLVLDHVMSQLEAAAVAAKRGFVPYGVVQKQDSTQQTPSTSPQSQTPTVQSSGDVDQKQPHYTIGKEAVRKSGR